MTTSGTGIGKRLSQWVRRLVSLINLSSKLNLGMTLFRKMRDAVPERNKQVAHYELFQLSFLSEQIAEWTAAVESWEKDQSSVNPFVSTVISEYCCYRFNRSSLTTTRFNPGCRSQKDLRGGGQEHRGGGCIRTPYRNFCQRVDRNGNGFRSPAVRELQFVPTLGV
jgi:hypothetical protein